MPAWVLDMTGVFLGAVLGALFGYASTRWQSRQEDRARRGTLYRLLSDQVHLIPLSTPEYDPSVLLTRSTIHVSAVGQLLGGRLLDATKDAALIRRLVVWQSLEASHNETVRIYNQAIVAGQLPKSHWSAWHANLDNAIGLLREWRTSVLSALPPEYRSPSWRVEAEGTPDEGILIQHEADTTSTNR